MIFQFFEGSNSTGAKPYSRPSTLLSTGANVPVAPVESAPMDQCIVTVLAIAIVIVYLGVS